MLLKKTKTPRKSPEKRTFLSLAFYNAPSLHTNYHSRVRSRVSGRQQSRGKNSINCIEHMRIAILPGQAEESNVGLAQSHSRGVSEGSWPNPLNKSQKRVSGRLCESKITCLLTLETQFRLFLVVGRDYSETPAALPLRLSFYFLSWGSF